MFEVIKRLPYGIYFVLFYAWEVIASNWDVLCAVLNPQLKIKPGIVRIPLELKEDFSINLLANLITMTPGTMSVDVSEDKKNLYVYALQIDDAEKLKKQIKIRLEAKIKKLCE